MSKLGAWILWAVVGALYHLAKHQLGFDASVNDWTASVYWSAFPLLMIHFGVVRP